MNLSTINKLIFIFIQSEMDKPRPKIDIPALAGAKKEDKKIRYI